MVVSAQAFVVMISSFVPLPGAAGGAEFSFKTFFAPFFSPYHISVNPAMLLWRFITFYLPIIVGACFMATYPKLKEDAERLTVSSEATLSSKEGLADE